MIYWDDSVETQSMFCGNCGQQLVWRSDDDSQFSGVVSMLAHHVNHDKTCLRIKKLSIIEGTNKPLAQDHYYDWKILDIKK